MMPGSAPITTAATKAPPRRRRTTATAAPARWPVAQPAADLECDMLVLGAGPGGYSAAFRAADLGLEDRARRALRHARRRLPQRRLHSVEGAAARRRGDGGSGARRRLGISFAPPKVDIDKLRAHKAKVVGKLTTGLAGMAKGAQGAASCAATAISSMPITSRSRRPPATRRTRPARRR